MLALPLLFAVKESSRIAGGTCLCSREVFASFRTYVVRFAETPVSYKLQHSILRAATSCFFRGQNDCNLYLTTFHVFLNFLGEIARLPPTIGCGPATPMA